MTPQYRIEKQYFDEKFESGTLIQLKEIATGNVIHKSPLDLFNDPVFLKKLSVMDVLLIGYIVGEDRMYQSQKFIYTHEEWSDVAIDV